MKLSDSLAPYIFCLKVIGAWPGDSQYSKFFSSAGIVLFNVIHNLSLLVHIIIEPGDVVSCVPVFLTQSVTLCKIYFFFRYSNVNKCLLEQLNRKEFTPKLCQQHIAKRVLKGWQVINKAYMALTALAVFFWIMLRILDKDFKKKVLPYRAWYPFEITSSPLYEIMYFYQSLSLVYIAFSNACADIYLSGLITHIAVQCEILCNNLENMERYTKECLKKKRITDDELEESFKNCLKHHYLILDFSEDVGLLTNYTVFSQFVASLLPYSATLLYMSSLSPSKIEFWTNALYLGAIFVQLLLYCWSGNEVVIKSSNIFFATFECGWDKCTVSVKKRVLFFMTRIQRPIQIQVFNFFVLSLNTFMSMVRMSYSYFAVLNSITN